jgi:hypothetical protein
MADTYNKKINRNTDWGGDSSTNWLPVAGNRVQEFIKDELNLKSGAFYKPTGGNFVYCFATKENRDLFLETGDESLIVDTFETESNYSVYINPETLVLSKSVIEGSTGNTIEFQFKITDRNDIVSDSKASIVFTFLASGIIKKYTTEIQVKSEGWTTVVSDVIDDYLRSGENTITVSITGLSTKTSSQFVMTYNVFDLDYRTSFQYNVVQNTNAISVPYYIKCTETKYIEFFIDGVEVQSAEQQVIYDGVKEGSFNISIIPFSNGQHSLQTRAYVKANDGTRFYSDMYYYTFAKQGEVAPSFLMYAKFDNTQALQAEGENLKISSKQFEEISFDWSLYDYLSRKLTVNFEYNGDILSKTVFTLNGTINEFSFRPLNYGDDNVLRIYSLDDDNNVVFEHFIEFDIAGSETGIKETVDGLLLKLSAVGRRNTDEDKDVWTCIGNDMNVYRADFHNFEWNAQQGWDDKTESLVISNGAYVDFNIQPMINHWESNGGTFEIDLETFDIEDEDAVICECMNHIEGINTAYFRITATNAEFGTTEGKKINTRYKDNERLKIAFIGNRTGTTSEDGNLIYIMVNGVLERASLYNNTDKIFSDSYLRVGAIDGGCKVRLHSIRVYDRAIRVDEEFNNFVVDSDDSQIIYERNNIFKAGTNEVGFDEVANKIPVMIFTGDMQELVRNGQDKQWRYFDVEYINRQEPERNFVSFNCQMKLQGTSSLGYPRKNFKLKTKDKLVTEEYYNSSNYILDTDESEIGNRRLRNKITDELLDFGDVTGNCFTFDYRGRILKKGKYKFKGSSHKADKWTLKADYMESSCSHNVAAGRSWNDIFENTKLSISQYAGYTNNTYRDSALIDRNEYEVYEKNGVRYRINNYTDALNAQKDYVCRTDAQKICHAENADDIRTAIDGFPMVCFYRTSHAENNLIFMGQYNFINDKGSYEVFGFEDIEDPNDEDTMIYDATKVECWEGLKNSNPISLFKTIEDWEGTDGYKSTFESRYPDPDDEGKEGKRQVDGSVGSPLYELCKWITSTRHENDTVYGGTLDIDASFARRINGYQYAYVTGQEENYQYASGTNLEDNAENRQKKFETEKWEHFDVWKLAGYYIYLMRYGAVDQFVKNTMLFTDGNGRYDSRPDNKYRKWFYINYDNDCLFGLRNNGELAFGWDLDRQTIDNASDIIVDENDEYTEDDVNTYAMMGHDSTLWNNLEADEEFMRMVRDLDDSMSRGGLNYNNMVKEFDTDQTERWCERIYNSNERYKYIQAAKGTGDMQGNPVDNLWMLQGTRRSHRHWWIANHFNMFDARWLSGDYKNTYIQIKTDTRAGTRITAVAGADYYYAWGQQKRIYESNIVKSEGDPIEFIFPTDQVQGDPVYIYAYNKMSEIDFSEIANKIAAGSFEFYEGGLEVANTLKKFIIGNPNLPPNNTDIRTSTWVKLKNLEYLDITNFAGINSIPFSLDVELDDGTIKTMSLSNLHTLKAGGSGLASFTPVEGSRFDLVELPNSISTIILNNIQFTDLANQFVYSPNKNLSHLEISKTNGIDMTYFTKFVRPWLTAINESPSSEALYASAKLKLNNVDWTFASFNDILLFENISKVKDAFTISGVINLSSLNSISMENIEKIKSIFGENCFSSTMSAIYIKVPETVFIHSDKEEDVAGKVNVFRREIYPSENALSFAHTIEYFLVKETEYTERSIFDPITNKYYEILTDAEIAEIRGGTVSLVNAKDENDREIGILYSDEVVDRSDTNIKVMCMLTMAGAKKVSVCDYKIKDPTYATSATIVGEKSFYKNNEYIMRVVLKDVLGREPIGTEDVNWTITMTDKDYYLSSYEKVDEHGIEYRIVTSGNEPDENLVSVQIHISVEVTNFNGGNHLFANYMALMLNGNVIMTSESNPVIMSRCYNAWPSIIHNQNAITKQQAEQITDIAEVFAGIPNEITFNEFKYFKGLTEIGNGAFAGSKITEITIPDTVTSIGDGAFSTCKKLYKISSVNGDYSLPNIETINERTFVGCESLNKLRLPNTIKLIKDFAFGGTGFRKVLLSTDELVDGTLLLPDAETEWRIEGSAFETSSWKTTSVSNKLTLFTIQKNLNLTNNEQILYGRYYTRYDVEYGCTNYISEDGVLYSSNNGVDKYSLIKYPALKNEVEIETLTLEDIQSVDNYAFLYCVNLNEVILPNTILNYNLRRNCFEKSDVKIVNMSNSSSLNGIPDFCFYDCTELTDVILPMGNSIVDVGRNAFYNCPSLTGLTLTNGIKNFAKLNYDDSNFYNCGFSELIFPDSVINFDTYLVRGCNNLTYVKFGKLMDTSEQNIVCDCANLERVKLPCFSYTDSEDNNIIVNEKYHSYFVNTCPKLNEFIKNEVDNEHLFTIVDGVIYKENKIIKVPFNKGNFELKEGTTIVGEGAYGRCNNIANIDDRLVNIVEIERGAFEYSTLTSLTINNLISSIPTNFVSGCKDLTTLYLGNNISVINPYAFGGCKNLSKIYIFTDAAPRLYKLSNYHPFGSSAVGDVYSYAGYDSKVYGNSIFVVHGSTGYDFDGDESSASWIHPVTDNDKCGYSFEDIVINGVIEMNVSNSAPYLFVKSELGGLHDEGNDCSVAMKISDNLYQFNIGDNTVYHGEKITVYSDSDCQIEIGYFYADLLTSEYSVNHNLGTRVVLDTGNKNETIEIGKDEYDMIMNNLRYLNKMINKK